MAHCSRRTSSKCERSRAEPEVTLDDVAAVVAGLNSKVLQLRRDIRELSDSPQADGRAGCRNIKKRKSKIEARKTSTRTDEEDVMARRRKSSSNSIRKASKCQRAEDFLEENENTSTTPYFSEDLQRKSRISREKTRENSFDQGIPGEMLIRPIERGGPRVSGRTVTRTRGSNESSARVDSEDTKNEATQTLVKPKQTSKIAEEFPVVKSIHKSEKNNKAAFTRQQSFKRPNGSGNVARVSNERATNPRDHDRNRKSSKEHERSIIKTECAAIRHALGLSTPYCNCASTGSAVRRVRRKRISRGVQCTEPLKLKNKRSGCLGGCFTFKCCVARAKRSERKRLKNAAGNEQQNSESSGTYKPKNNNEKKQEESQKKVDKDSRETNVRTRRISGGAEHTESVKRLEHHPRRKSQDVARVKKRLNECLIELNGIIGDVAYMFK